ncbi:MAG: DUF47 domain-containing protein [Acidobacteria bacterium]|nr:DUF47 domain-containing protein [Acidobacteriota bacterium]MBI3279855.1 DUF47 domain-containing protein [Acidobacteriota bacterium]
MRLLPREEKFFGYFMQQVELISLASRALLAGVASGDATVLAKAAQEVAEIEQKGDEVIHEVFHKLNQTFITPLDPEDLHSLSSHLDDVLDGLEDSAHRLVAYRLDKIPRVVIHVCERLVACTHALLLAFQALSDHRKVLDHCIEVNRIEGEVDQIVREAVIELFEHEKDPITVIKLKEIYEFLEITSDRCEDVADVLQNVVVKNS